MKSADERLAVVYRADGRYQEAHVPKPKADPGTSMQARTLGRDFFPDFQLCGRHQLCSPVTHSVAEAPRVAQLVDHANAAELTTCITR